MTADATWNVYLSGEIHSDWRDRIADGVREAGLPVELLAPVTDHSASDDVGASILGEEEDQFWRDHKGAGVNAVRTQTLLRRAYLVIGAIVASGHHYFEHVDHIKQVAEAALAVVLWPLVLLGVSMRF